SPLPCRNCRAETATAERMSRTQRTTDDEVVAFVSQYGNPSNIVAITEPGVFQNMIIVEFDSGNALCELRKILPYTYSCYREKVTYDILELATICADSFGELKTREYLGELKQLAKLTGRDYAEVLTGLMSLLGQSITEQSPTHPDSRKEVMPTVPSTAAQRCQPQPASRCYGYGTQFQR
ncbi:paraneoplastic antigen Ma3 homolog, partial [Scomber scombrus]